jgi:LytR cell envelope-related transcriptional attenuator
MTTPGRYAASDGSFAKSAGSAAARGGVLIALAVVIGVVLLWKGFDGGAADADIGDAQSGVADTGNGTGGDGGDQGTVPGDSSDSTGEVADTSDVDGDGTTPPESSDSVATVIDDPSDVTVVVLNGTSTGGLAGNRSSALGAVGYVVTAGNAATNDVAVSTVYFLPGFADEAGEVVAALSGPAGVLSPAPADPVALAADGSAEATGAADVIVVLGADGALS